MLQAAVSGLVSGGAYALLGVCLVLTFRMTGVLNFAEAGIGAFGIYVAVELHHHGWTYAIAAPLGAGAATLLAVGIGLAMKRWFGNASVEAKASVSVAILLALLAIGNRLFGPNALQFPTLLGGVHPEIAGVVISGVTILSIVAAIVMAAALSIFLRSTRTGHQLRGLAQRPRTAELHAIPVSRLVVIVWAVSGFASFCAIFLVAPSEPSAFSSLTILIVPVAGAALVGLFRSFGLTLVGGLLVGVATAVMANIRSLASFHDVLPAIIVVAVLLVRERYAVWDAAR